MADFDANSHVTDPCAETDAATRPKRKRQGGRRNGSRREGIIAALRQCMIDKGYAETSLTDVASIAGMTVSHLLYYYASKDLILLDIADELHRPIVANLASHRDQPPEERIHILADNLSVSNVANSTEMVIIRDIMALAGHRPKLREIFIAQNEVMRTYLEELFAETPRQPGMSALDVAEIASALWVGFMHTVGYDDRLNSNMARRLFRRTLLTLANFEAAPPAVVANPGPRARPKPAAKRPTHREA